MILESSRTRKYDENQKDYHSTSLDEFSMFVIPIDAPDMDKTAFITEALCAESYKKVVPVFYDVVLKTKNARDNDSAQMIDIAVFGDRDKPSAKGRAAARVKFFDIPNHF